MNDWKKAILVQAGLLAAQVVIYIGTQLIIGEPHTLGGALDARIPFLPWFVYFYLAWFFLLAGTPLLLFYYSRELFARYCAAMAALLAVAGIAFVVYPTCVIRPIPPSGLSGWLVSVVYGADSLAANCLPSVHCASSMLFSAAALRCRRMPRLYKWGITVLSLLICASTLFIKQHVVIDVITAAPAAGIAILCAELIDPKRLLTLLRIAPAGEPCPAFLSSRRQSSPL